MGKKITVAVRLIGAVAVFMGLRLVFPGFGSIQFVTAENLNDHGVQFFLFLLFIQILKVLSGSGLLFLKNWGRNLAIPVLILESLVRLAGVINYWTYTLRHPETSTIPPEGTIKAVISLWPGYVDFLIILISLLVLLSKPVAKVFNQKRSVNQELSF
jgi:hypothetical protein